MQIGLKAGMVVGPNIGEDLLVALSPRGLEGGRQRAAWQSPASATEIDVCADDADVIEGVRETRERGNILKADDAFVGRIDRDVKNPTLGKSRMKTRSSSTVTGVSSAV